MAQLQRALGSGASWVRGRALLAAGLGWVAIVLGDLAHAQSVYPSRPVKVVVPITAGGAPDIAGRLVAEQLSEALGQPFVVENRPGSNGNIGMELVAKAPPDGHVLALAADSMIVVNPHVYKKLPFDPLRDVVPVASVASNQFVISVNPKLPAKTLPEFVAYAKSASPPLSYGSGGNGSQHQLAMEHLKQLAGINLLHVPYKGAAPAVTAAISGEVAVLFSGSASSPHFKSGALRPLAVSGGRPFKLSGLNAPDLRPLAVSGGRPFKLFPDLRPLAVSGGRPFKLFPDLPRVADFYPGFDVTIWVGLFAPAPTPAAIVERLHATVRQIMAQPGFAEKLNVSGSLEPLMLSPDEFAKRILDDHERYGRIVREIGVKLD